MSTTKLENMMTGTNYADLAFFTPTVKPLLQRLGSAEDCTGTLGGSVKTQLGAGETAFISERDWFYVAATGEDRWAYTQRHNGPKGFLQVVDATTLGFVSRASSRRYISAGKALLFLIDHNLKAQLKIWADAEVSKDRDVVQQLATGITQTPITHLAFLFHVRAFGWNYEKDALPEFESEMHSTKTPRSDRSDLSSTSPTYGKRCLSLDAGSGVWTLNAGKVSVLEGSSGNIALKP